VRANGIVLDALGDWTRRQILEGLKAGPRSVGDLAAGLPVSRPAVSQHLRVLEQAGLVSHRKDGTRRIYRVEPNGLAQVREYFDSFWGDVLEHFAAEARKENEMSTVALDTIRKTVLVDFAPADAFELFTARIATWWPVRTHSYGGEKVTSVVFEGHVGGRVYEVTADGEQDWARVLAFDPPNGFLLEWLIGEACGSEVEVTFTAEGPGSRVVLEHRGFEQAESRDNYAGGWDVVLAPFVEAAKH
jgi:DNA-binding transcriptional ArsR family regulator/uncharacterized protein YndB with AHSA1/START domain